MKLSYEELERRYQLEINSKQIEISEKDKRIIELEEQLKLTQAHIDLLHKPKIKVGPTIGDMIVERDKEIFQLRQEIYKAQTRALEAGACHLAAEKELLYRERQIEQLQRRLNDENDKKND